MVESDRESSAPDKRLRKYYIIGLSLVALFSCLFAVIVHIRIQAQEMDSRVINIAGRQRMLSQKLTKTALLIDGVGESDEPVAHLQEMREALAMWSRSHRGLTNGDSEMGLPAVSNSAIKEKFGALEVTYQTMVGACGEIIALRNVGENVNSVLAVEAQFLKEMNEIVFMYDEASRSKVLVLKRTEWILSGLVIGLLLFVAMVVFEPAVRLIRRQFVKLESVATERQQLIDDLSLALAAVKQLKGLLPICASCKNIRDDKGFWSRIEEYIEGHSDAQFTHGLCPDCADRLYPRP